MALLSLPASLWAQSILVTEPATPALYTQAMVALQVGNTDLAEKLLQELVQQQPDWAGAWLDLSLIAFRKANYAQAEEFILILEQRFSPLPQAVQTAVGQMRKQLAVYLKPTPTLSASWVDRFTQSAQQQTSLSLATGYDNNVNAGLRFNAITLTLPDRTVDLTLAPSNQPMGAVYARAALVHQTKFTFNEVDASFQMQAQARHYNNLPQFGNLELVPQLTLENGGLPGVTTLGFQVISLNHVLTYKAPILRWQAEQALPVCKLNHQVQLEDRQYAVSSYLNSQWLSYKPSVHCESANRKFIGYGQVSQEMAKSEARPGQNTNAVLLGFQYDWLSPWGWQGHRLQVRAEFQQSLDTAGYSYLLDNGNPRKLQNKLGLVNWSAPLSGQSGWRWNIGVQSNRQSSNLSVFTLRNYSLESSIWRGW